MNILIARLRKSWKIDATGFAAAALLTAAAFMLGFKPMLEHEARQLAQRYQAAQHRQQLSELNTTLDQLRRERAQVRQTIAESKVRLQPVSQLNTHVSRIANLAAASGLRVHEVEIGEMVRHEHYETAPIRLAGDGSYPACASFMHRLHEAFPDTAVASLALTGRPQQADDLTAFHFTLTWHAAPSTD